MRIKQRIVFSITIVCVSIPSWLRLRSSHNVGCCIDGSSTSVVSGTFVVSGALVVGSAFGIVGNAVVVGSAVVIFGSAVVVSSAFVVVGSVFVIVGSAVVVVVGSAIVCSIIGFMDGIIITGVKCKLWPRREFRARS